MLPTSVSTSRADASSEQRQRGLVRQQLFQGGGGNGVENEQRVAADRAAEHAGGRSRLRPSMHSPSVSLRRSIGWMATCGTSSRTRCPVRLESDAPARPKPMFSSSTSASCWAGLSSTHALPSSVVRISGRISSASSGLTRNPDAPASFTIRCEDVCTSADTTITFDALIHLAQLGEDVEAVHPFHHRDPA